MNKAGTKIDRNFTPQSYQRSAQRPQKRSHPAQHNPKPYGDHYGIGSDLIGEIVAIATGLSMFGRAIVGWLSDRKSKKRLVLVSLVVMTISYILYLLPVTVILVTVARIFQGIGNGMLITVLSTLALENIPPERFGEGIGIYSLSSALAQCVSPMLGTNLAKAGMFQLIFISALVTTVVAIFILSFIQSSVPILSFFAAFFMAWDLVPYNPPVK